MPAGCAPNRSEALLVAARNLAVDAATARVVDVLRREGIDPILLKGPSLASWLYREHAAGRDYVDTDLLVGPEDFERAMSLLGDMGFEPHPSEGEPPPGIAHAERLVPRSEGFEVDLHRTLFGVGVSPHDAWRELSADTDSMAVGGTVVRVLGLPARALQVALHTAQHGPGVAKPLADLSRALDQVDDDTWRAAAHLADRLDAAQTLSAGLRVIPEGALLADRLGLMGAEVAALARAGQTRAPLAAGLDRLLHVDGWRSKVTLLAREAVPSREYLRWWSPLARRGPGGLAAAYAWRPLWLLWHAPRSMLALRRARRSR